MPSEVERLKFADQFRKALDDGDAMLCWRMWAHVMPHLPQPKTLGEAEIVMHAARTAADSIPLRKRAYSHAWLLERGLPSNLPDALKPKAERLYPRVVSAVGISVNMPKMMRGVAIEVRKSMGDAVEELHADGVDLSNRPLVHGRMFEARSQTLKRLGI